jgi:hypothetical protein
LHLLHQFHLLGPDQHSQHIHCYTTIDTALFYCYWDRPLRLGPMLPVSLDCPFLIYPSVFSYVYLSTIVKQS